MAKTFDELQFSDSYMFKKILEGEPELVTSILNAVLGENAPESVHFVGTSDTEVLVKDKRRKEYVLTVPDSEPDEFHKRMHYYDSMIVSSLYVFVKRAVILICRKNYFNSSQPTMVYDWNVDSKLDPTPGVASSVIVLNAYMYSDDRLSADLQALLRYVMTGVATDTLTETIAEKVAQIKADPKRRAEYEASQRAN